MEESGEEVNTGKILSAIGDYENEKAIPKVETNIYQSPDEIPEGYEDALKRLKQAQSKLTPVLLNKYPEAKPIYDNIVKQGVERAKTYQQKLPDYYLTPQEQQSVLKDQYDQYQMDLKLVSSHMSKLYPGLAELRGSEEEENAPLKYGLRTASFGQYTGAPRTNVVADIKKYSTMTGVPKVDNGQ